MTEILAGLHLSNGYTDSIYISECRRDCRNALHWVSALSVMVRITFNNLFSALALFIVVGLALLGGKYDYADLLGNS